MFCRMICGALAPLAFFVSIGRGGATRARIQRRHRRAAVVAGGAQLAHVPAHVRLAGLQPARSDHGAQRLRLVPVWSAVDGHGRRPSGAADRQRRRHVRHDAVQPGARVRRARPATSCGAIAARCRPTSAWATRPIAASRFTATRCSWPRPTRSVVALDARTGRVVWDVAVEDYNGGYYMTLAPLAARGKIMVGVSGGERGIRGFVVALDAETGKEVWKTYTVPAPGRARQRDLARRLVEDRRRARSGSRAASIPISGSRIGAPATRGLGPATSGPATISTRTRSSRSTSTPARCARTTSITGTTRGTGTRCRRRCSIDVRRNGRTIKGLVHPAPQRLSLAARAQRGRDLVRRRQAVRDAERLHEHRPKTRAGPSTTWRTSPAIGNRATYCPSLWGGKDWPPAAYNPKTRYLYIPANENLCTEMEGEEVEYRRGQQFTGAHDRRISRWRPGADHIGELQAWNLDTGERAWTHEFESPNWGPVLDDGGGARVRGRHDDRYFRAFDAASGKLLWQYRTNSGITGVPTRSRSTACNTSPCNPAGASTRKA